MIKRKNSNFRIVIVLCFLISHFNIKAQEVDDLEAELLMLQGKMSIKDSIQAVEKIKRDIKRDNEEKIGHLNSDFLVSFRANEFQILDDLLGQGMQILSSDNAPNCVYSADFFINFSDYLLIQGREKDYYELLALVPEDCTFKIAEYLQLIHLNSVGRFEESQKIVEKMNINPNPECFQEDATYDEQLSCYRDLGLYSSMYVGTLLNISLLRNQQGDIKGALDYAQAAINMASISKNEEMSFVTALSKASLHFSLNEIDKVYKLLTPFEENVEQFPSVYLKEYYRLMQAIASAKGDEREEREASEQMMSSSADIRELKTTEEQIDAAFRSYEMQRMMGRMDNGIFSDKETSLERIVRELEESGQTNSFNYAKALIMLSATSKSAWSFSFDDPKDILESKLHNISSDQYRLPVIKELAALTFNELDDDAFSYLEEMRDIAARINQKVVHFQATTQLAYLNDMYDMNEDALFFYQEAINEALVLIIDYYPFLTEREQFFFNSKWIQPLERSVLTFYLKAPDLGVSLDQPLLNFRLRTKSLILENSSRTRILVEKSDDPDLKSLYDELRIAKEGLSMKQNELDWKSKSEKVSAIESLEERIRIRLGLDQKNKAVSDLLTIQKSLNDKEAAVEIIRFQKATGEFLTDSVAYIAFVVSNNQKLNKVVFPSPHLMENVGFDFYLRTIKFKIDDKRSYGEFWEPLMPLVKDYKRLYISSDGVFNGINLGAIKNPKTNKFLFEDQSFIQISSLRDITSRKKKKEMKLNKSVFIGRPKYFLSESSEEAENRGAIMADLPGTEKEVLAISEKLERKQVSFTNYLGEEAKENVVKKLNSPSILHIATHGFFDRKAADEDEFDSPLLSSGLLMSGAGVKGDTDGQDGVLSAYEITGINLTGTDLVVLSACESGVGESRDGQGIYGLSRAFFIAGAKTVIASLWKVDDTATQKFMNLFYEQWLETYSVPESMDFARDELKKEYPQPYYWAAFVATGGF